MVAISQAETAKIIRDLLRIAKVAMPGDLYDQDPRVRIALTALRQLESTGSEGRPPNVTSRPPALDVAAMTPGRPIEMSSTGASFVLDIPWDMLEALGTAAEHFARLDTPETIQFALRDWLTVQGYLDPGPEQVS